MVNYTADDFFDISGRGKVALIKGLEANDVEDILSRVGKSITINSTSYLVRGVERRACLCEHHNHMVGVLISETKEKVVQEIKVHTSREFDLLGFLSSQNFEVEVLSENVFKITRGEEELPVFLSHNTGSLYFEVDLGNITEITSQALLQELLDLNTEVLPVSFGFNSTNPADPRLVLVESRVTGDLSDTELLSVFDALGIAADKAERVLAAHLS